MPGGSSAAAILDADGNIDRVRTSDGAVYVIASTVATESAAAATEAARGERRVRGGLDVRGAARFRRGREGGSRAEAGGGPAEEQHRPGAEQRGGEGHDLHGARIR